ncbi:MAG TPA: toll/interleukin-1 receptor domain-containing protein [Bryobacteraceae bacterium]|nr:toll/interleukin-1 receptor domain-containing protein [Bryobacteraceae bacterium]
MPITDKERDELYALVLSPDTGPPLTESERVVLQSLILRPEGIKPEDAMKRASGKPPTMLNYMGQEELRRMLYSISESLGAYFDKFGPGKNSPYRLSIDHEIITGEYYLKVSENEPSSFLERGERTLREFALKNDKLAPQVFLCHSKGDKEIVKRIHSHLIDNGFRTWLDEADLLPGQEWDTEIKKAVRESDVVLVCLSKSSITKEGYVQKEVKFALDVADEKPEGMIYIIPARLEDCELPPRLSKWQAVDLHKPGGFDRLELAIRVKMEAKGTL